MLAEYIVISIWGTLLLISVIIWMIKKGDPFFESRTPLLTTFSQIYAYITVILCLFIGGSDNEIGCQTMGYLFTFLLPVALGPMFLLMPSLILNSYLNSEKENLSHGIKKRIWKLKIFTYDYVQFGIILILSIIHLSIYLIFYYLLPSSESENPGDCYRLPLFIFNAMMILYFIPFGVLMAKTKILSDPYYIRPQLIFSWILTSPLTIITIIYPFNPSLFGFDFRYIFVTSNGVMFLIIYFLPIFSLFRCFQKGMKKVSSREFSSELVELKFENLLEVSTRKWCPEILLAFRAIKDFEINPTLQKKENLIKNFINRGAELEINISDQVYQDVIERTSLDIEDRNVFEPVKQELLLSIRYNIYPHL